jgi:hypothetical protein
VVDCLFNSMLRAVSRVDIRRREILRSGSRYSVVSQ